MAMSNSVGLAAEVVAAYVSNNPLPKSDLPDLILAVHSSVARLGSEPERALPQAETKSPAVPIRRSVTPDYLICLEDGRQFKSLRRHLAGLGLTPEQYREKWKLPSDYPMVAPNYAAYGQRWRKRSGWVRNGGRRADSCSIFGTAQSVQRGRRAMRYWLCVRVAQLPRRGRNPVTALPSKFLIGGRLSTPVEMPRAGAEA